MNVALAPISAVTPAVAPDREPATGLLRRLLEAAGWRGEDRGLIHAAPHLPTGVAARDLLATLENLGAPHVVAEGRLERLSREDCPCLLIPSEGAALAALDARPGEGLLLAPGEAEPVWRPLPSGRGQVVRLLPAGEGALRRVRAVADLLAGARGTVATLLFASLFTNLIAFATPLLVMTVYDTAIPAGEPAFVGALFAAMAMIFVADGALRTVRAAVVAGLGARVERGLSLALFRKLTAMPLAQLEKSGVHEQLARLRQFESLRDLFTGPLFAALLDLPFTFLFLVAIFILSPAVGFMLVGVAAVFLIAAFAAAPTRRRLNETAARSRTEHQRLLHEIATSQLAIQRLGAEAAWAERAERLAARTAADARRARTAAVASQAFGQSLMMLAGVGVVGFGAAQAISGALSFGALIALMALVWRFLAPIQALYAAYGQIETFAKSRRQADRVLALPEEPARGAAALRRKGFRGRIDLVNVTHRFEPGADPVLTGVSIGVGAGELAIICGAGGSGRSTLLSIVTRLYTPTAGAVLFDGVDYRQIATDELRGAISHDLQSPDFLHGTIRQNFEMAHPTASEAEIWAWLYRLRLGDEVRRLPEGLDTRLTEALLSRLSRAMVKGLSLTRCLMRPASIYLFAEPCAGLDNNHERAFLDVIAGMKGRNTVIMTSNRPSHFEMADRLILLDRGRVAVNETGPAARRKVAAWQAHLEGR